MNFLLRKNVLLDKIEHSFLFYYSNIVVSGCFLLSNSHKYYIWNFRYKGRVNINFRTQCVTITQTRWSPTPCHMRYFQNSGKNYSFLKLFVSIFILDNLIVGWVRGLLIKGLAFCIKSIDLGSVKSSGSRIYQSKSWYYLGLSQTSKMEFFTEIVFDYKPLFPTLMFNWFHKILPKTLFMFC